MRVLMFGWEFPPFKSGGLGTACKGMASALAARGTGVVFVLPRTGRRQPQETEPAPEEELTPKEPDMSELFALCTIFLAKTLSFQLAILHRSFSHLGSSSIT